MIIMRQGCVQTCWVGQHLSEAWQVWGCPQPRRMRKWMLNFTERISLNSVSNTTTPRPSPHSIAQHLISCSPVQCHVHPCQESYPGLSSSIQRLRMLPLLQHCSPPHSCQGDILENFFRANTSALFSYTISSTLYPGLSRSSVASRLKSLLKYFQGLRLFQHCSPPHLSQSFPPIQIVMTSKQWQKGRLWLLPFCSHLSPDPPFDPWPGLNRFQKSTSHSEVVV